ncbi:cytochrome c biogenesis CcdA family protein [Heliorestis convoluta]|uniref:Cytochrome c-type biogenesis protein n=1 Tax=Heliorestis convoluta TaxID=356322 RepID=A0A5Q2MWL7_9FIRM|nr:cytochrome c biogenesis protein CcdA [Heliorestis convoluta]QGG46828.1 cytochrome c-type biogenesis protein [Heliorestis convoluta]
MDSVSLLVAFFAGIASFLSPCILPLIPAYITYLTGTSSQDLNKATERSLGPVNRLNFTSFWRALAFVIGFSSVFIAFGASATYAGQWLWAYQSTLQTVAGVIIIIFGLHLTGLLPIHWLYREIRFTQQPKSSSFIGSILLGMAFATGWSPCVGPILSAIYLYAATKETLAQGIYLLVAYSAGLAIPFLVTALFITTVEKYLSRMGRYLPMVSIVSGAIMILLGILIITNQLGRVTAFFNFIPTF